MKPEQAHKTVAREGINSGGDAGNDAAPRSPHQHVRGRHAPLMGTTPPLGLGLGCISGAGNAGNNVALTSHHQHIRGRHPPLLGSAPPALVAQAGTNNPVAPPSHLLHVRGRHAPLDGTVAALRSQKTDKNAAPPGHLKHIRGRHAPLSRPAAPVPPRAPAPEGKKDVVVNVEVWVAVANAMV